MRYWFLACITGRMRSWHLLRYSSYIVAMGHLKEDIESFFVCIWLELCSPGLIFYDMYLRGCSREVIFVPFTKALDYLGPLWFSCCPSCVLYSEGNIIYSHSRVYNSYARALIISFIGVRGFLLP